MGKVGLRNYDSEIHSYAEEGLWPVCESLQGRIYN